MPRTFALLFILLAASPSLACPIYRPPTFREEAMRAQIVLLGKAQNTGILANDQVFTDIGIDKVIQANDELDPKAKVLTIPRLIPPNQGKESVLLLFVDVHKGNLDAYRIERVQAEVADYILGALTLDARDRPKSFQYFYRYLGHKDSEIGNDAYRELVQISEGSYLDFWTGAKDLSPAKAVELLQDPKTPLPQQGLCALILGHCGQDRDALLLRRWLDGMRDPPYHVLADFLTGYTLLRPAEGLAFLQKLLRNEKLPFMTRYAGLRVLRFFWENRPDVLKRAQLIEGYRTLFEQSDIADLAVDDMRRSGWREESDRILGLYGRPSHAAPIIERAIIRYALCCPKEPRAVQFIKDVRRTDPDRVADMEELLKLEQPDPAVAKNRGPLGDLP